MNSIQPNTILLTPAIDSTLAYQYSSNSLMKTIEDIRIVTSLRIGGQVIGNVETAFHDLIEQQIKLSKYQPENKERIILLLDTMINDMINQVETIKKTP